jgi:predicted component of type VI protein secretion system
MPTLNIQLAGLPPVSHVLKDETITIGRMKGNTIVIEDSSISLMHAKITRKDGEYYLKDLNSTNGTVLNGQPLGEAKLRDMDQVRFAVILGQYLAETPAAAIAPTPQSLPGDAFASQSISVPVPVPIASPLSAPAPLGAVPLLKTTPASILPAPSRSQTSNTTVLTRRVWGNKNAARALAVGAVAVLVGGGIGGWMFFQGRRERTNKFAWRAPASQPPTKSLNKDAAQVAGPKASAASVKPIPEADASMATLGVAQWVKSLKSLDPAERRQAATSLHSAGTEARAAIPELREALKDSDPDVQLWSALALVNTQTYDKAVIPILVHSLHNNNSVVRQVGCLSLGLIPYDAADKDTVVPALAEVAGKDSDQEVRHSAKSALSIIAPELSDTALSK